MAAAHVLYEDMVAEDAIAGFVMGGPIALAAVGGATWVGARRVIGEGWALALAAVAAPLWWFGMINAPQLAEEYGVSRSVVVGSTGGWVLLIASAIVVANAGAAGRGAGNTPGSGPASPTPGDPRLR